MRAKGCNCFLQYETKTKEVYFESRKHKLRSALVPEGNRQTAASTVTLILNVDINKEDFTVYDGDVSAFVVLGQC